MGRTQTILEDGSSWYVARIKAAQTDFAISSLQKRMIEFCYPMYREHGSEHPLISGYVFTRLQNDGDVFAEVNALKGIDRLLPYDQDCPSAIPCNWMSTLQQNLSSGIYNIEAQVEPTELPRFNKSEILAIISGPFAGHTGTFVRVHKGAVDVDVAFFGRMINVTLRGHQVERLM